ncbi:putative DNA-dependent ATPase MCM, Nucleic acid-binding, OB-fold, ATPase, AAA+ type, core protein [Trachipleistophora hominis]|uniref:Putative DNA-dependent ATPase MCM, Nucleic acid-binding, OB-fold, ATPase, AAA+ type, core protein n=1 Tax=Trachipleistophora hominis TaxID=72359 RepID=L7JSV1_TRAHO|nr:putative DNA-dependent ATPase MCM, Nucleic acid-binding, OB-fold, ATPase, AAA+ type, core protein [Trachipleistophora hominis]
MMDVPSDFYSYAEINMLQLCHKHPIFAHNFVQNNHLFYEAMVDKKIKNVPPSLLLKRFPRCDKINHLVLLRGTIIKVNPILLKDVEQSYRCLYCDHSEIVKSANYKKKKKIVCERCGKDNFRIDEVFTKAKNCQAIRIQDIGNPQTMSDTIEILITGEQAGKFLPGENIEVLGIVRLKWPLLKINEKLSPVIYLQSHSIRRTEKTEPLKFEGLDDFVGVEHFDKQRFLIKTFMNEIVGCENVKLGILLSVIGKRGKDKETRNNSHVLLVGTPGTGKSHFLKSVAHLAHSVSINGVGTSEAGLTTCAVKQGKEWLLEAGALILADNGLCCIDSFDALPLYDKRGLLEVMEQQTLSVAKAGLVSTLNARCSVIAAYNISYYDTTKSICDNLKITSPLISRFDLIFFLMKSTGMTV